MRRDERRQRPAEVLLLGEAGADERPPGLIVVVVGALQDGSKRRSARLLWAGDKGAVSARKCGLRTHVDERDVAVRQLAALIGEAVVEHVGDADTGRAGTDDDNLVVVRRERPAARREVVGRRREGRSALRRRRRRRGRSAADAASGGRTTRWQTAGTRRANGTRRTTWLPQVEGGGKEARKGRRVGRRDGGRGSWCGGRGLRRGRPAKNRRRRQGVPSAESRGWAGLPDLTLSREPSCSTPSSKSPTIRSSRVRAAGRLGRVDEPGLTLAAASACPLAVGLPFVLGSLSGIATKDAVRSSWYTGMRAPAYRPPRQVGNGFDQA